jgi:hypothetical protein
MKTILLRLRWVALGYALVMAASRADAQQPGGSPFDGEWTLTFDVNTPPGGVTLRDMYGSNSPYHMHFHASKKTFEVTADGTFAWREVENGSLKINGTANYFGRQTKHWASHQPLLKAEGTATARLTPPGSPQPYDRTLEVILHYSGGNGATADNHGGGGAYIVDAAGEQMTVTGPTTTTLNVTYWQSKWNLKPARTTSEEISPDEIRETTTYEGSRQAEIPTLTSGKYKVTERIEVKHVRHPKLVPRG